MSVQMRRPKYSSLSELQMEDGTQPKRRSYRASNGQAILAWMGFVIILVAALVGDIPAWITMTTVSTSTSSSKGYMEKIDTSLGQVNQQLMGMLSTDFVPKCEIIVSNLNDSGPGSLRDAITQANERTDVACTIKCSVAHLY